MTHCITSRRGTSKLLELVPNPFDDINKICSKQSASNNTRVSTIFVMHSGSLRDARTLN